MKVATFMFELAKLDALLQAHVCIRKTELNMRFSMRIAVHSATYVTCELKRDYERVIILGFVFRHFNVIPSVFKKHNRVIYFVGN